MSTQENKLIASEILKTVYDKYPEWKKKPLSLPQPIYPQSMAGVAISQKQMAQMPFNEISKSVLCGTICGDSSLAINTGYKNARYQNRHSTRQAEWFVWKHRVVLSDLSSDSSVVFQRPDGYQKHSKVKPGEVLGKFKIASKADAKLTALHTVISPNNRKTIQRSWLNHMNNYFLMTIWLDDGSLYNGRQGLISFNSIPLDEQEVFRDYLFKVWDIKTHLVETGKVMSNGQVSYVIHLADIDNLLKLLRLVAPVIPVREMLYKVCFVPKDNLSLLQRWRTELESLVRPEFQNDIKKYYDAL